MVRDLAVSIPPSAAAQLIANTIKAPKTTLLGFGQKRGRLMDDYRIESDRGTYICQVYTRYYARVGSYVTLVVTITDVSGFTSVHMTTGGHKRFDGDTPDESDLGASASFIGTVEKALSDHLIPIVTK